MHKHSCFSKPGYIVTIRHLSNSNKSPLLIFSFISIPRPPYQLLLKMHIQYFINTLLYKIDKINFLHSIIIQISKTIINSFQINFKNLLMQSHILLSFLKNRNSLTIQLQKHQIVMRMVE